MQEQSTQKTVALSIHATQLSSEVLQNAIQIFLQRKGQGLPAKKLSLRSLVRQNGKLSNIEIKANTIKEFDRIAKKFHVTYSVMKNAGEQGSNNYVVFFRAKDVERMDMAFRKYANKKLQHKPSVLEKLQNAKEAALQLAKAREHIPRKEKGEEI